MSLSSESIYAALFDRLQSRVSGVRTFSRREIDYTQLDGDSQQPAIVLLEQGMTQDSKGQGQPVQWMLTATVEVYARSNDTDTPATVLLNFIDQVDAALQKQNGEPSFVPDETQTTLGGLVRRAWIEGRVEIWPGAAGDQAVAIIPISMHSPRK